jgi:hypothetical protein
MKRLLISILCSLTTMVLHAQDSTAVIEPQPVLTVYLDCQGCDVGYLAENLTIATFVTEPAAASVHLMVTQLNTGNGSTAISMIFSGRNRYRAIRDTVSFSVPADLTLEEKRMLQLEKIQLGLVPFIMKTPAANRLLLIVGDGFHHEEKKEKDPWRDWVFDLNGMGSVLAQKNYQSLYLNLGLNVSKITEKLKLESYNYLTYNESSLTYSYFDLDTNSDVTIQYNTVQRGFQSSNLAVRSIGHHFGIGGMAIFRSDQPNNMKLRIQAGPAIEFNVYPYKESLQKQFRFLYSIFYEHTEYIEPTIFDKMMDEGWKQNLRVMVRFSNTWGYLDASVLGSAYVEDLDRYSIGASVFSNIRVYRGFSVNFQCGLGMYRDRINQPKGFASFDEILTRQKEMATDYQYNISFGLTYRFGSNKMPPVNPRFSY